VEKLNYIRGLSYLDYRLLKNINTGLVLVVVKITLLFKIIYCVFFKEAARDFFAISKEH
jgi:hypothetical protein